MSRSRYLIGIDLGTTNCAVAYVDTKGRERPTADIRDFAVPQLVAPGESAPRAMLPSFLYLPGVHELPPGAARLPWNDGAGNIVGEFARAQGAKVPARLVSSAKSWLCHAGVDRRAAILPWGAPEDVPRISPVAASAAYLAHIRDAWNHEFAQDEPANRLENQDIVLTVPASFDEAARELTVESAQAAGYTNLTLLEEPQAAFYCWIVTHKDHWQREVRAGELILVCDIGGGTTDFSLITVIETDSGPGFRRVAVGDHLMLGGDNIDLALAHVVERKLGGARLDAEQWNALRFACRTAKEQLLGSADRSARYPVIIAGRGSRLIGGGVQSELSHAEVEAAALEGFFGRVAPGDEPARAGRTGLQEFGLPYVSDPSILKHLVKFLRMHAAEVAAHSGSARDDRPSRPDAILFNGGALQPEIVRRRIVDVVTSWFAAEPEARGPRVLVNPSLDLAVARGAAYYGVVRRGGGIRIGGGTARSFYIGLETHDPERPWLCVVPRDAQEGSEIALVGHDFDLLTGQPILFPLASSSVRPDDRPGDLVKADPDTIRALPALESMIRVGRKARGDRAAVSLAARVTEVGTIELWCQSRTDPRRWRLQFQMRGAGSQGQNESAQAGQVVLEQSDVDRAIDAVRESFTLPLASPDHAPARLIKRLEERLDGPRASWPPSALRALWDPLRDRAETRLASPSHESRWLNLAGYVLRPGVGFPRDELRVKALWSLFHQGVKHQKDVQCWAEWWILWRRVAAGLQRPHHEELERRLTPFLIPAKGSSPSRKAGRPKPESHELAEMWRCAAALERANLTTRQAYGDALLSERSTAPPHVVLWCLGRLGARAPLYAQAESALPRSVAERWLGVLLGRAFTGERETADAIFALSELARVTGDRARDVSDDLRAAVLERLLALGAQGEAVAPVREYHERALAEQSAALGDALPVGLRLTSTPAAGT